MFARAFVLVSLLSFPSSVAMGASCADETDQTTLLQSRVRIVHSAISDELGSSSDDVKERRLLEMSSSEDLLPVGFAVAESANVLPVGVPVAEKSRSSETSLEHSPNSFPARDPKSGFKGDATSLVGREVKHAKSTEAALICAEDDEDDIPYTKSCPKEAIIEKDWCEETCAEPASPLGAALGMKAGSCAAQGFMAAAEACAGIHNATVFEKKDDKTLPSAGTFTAPSDCDPIFSIKGKVCEMICMGPKGKAMEQFALKRTGVKKGLCSANGYSHFVGVVKLRALVRILK